jgi:hypothetical protein
MNAMNASQGERESQGGSFSIYQAAFHSVGFRGRGWDSFA